MFEIGVVTDAKKNVWGSFERTGWKIQFFGESFAGGCSGVFQKCGMVEVDCNLLRMRKEKNVGMREKIEKCRKTPNTSENSLEEW